MPPPDPAPAAASDDDDDGMIQLPPGLEASVPSASAVAPERFIGGPPPAAPVISITSPAAAPAEVTVPEAGFDDATRVAAPRRSRARWRLVLPTGEEHVLTASTVVGRTPSAKAADGASDVIVVEDPDGLISKSHAVFELEAGRLWVRDLGSTNGVVVVGSDDSEREVSTDKPTELGEGDEVELGSYAIQIKRGAS